MILADPQKGSALNFECFSAHRHSANRLHLGEAKRIMFFRPYCNTVLRKNFLDDSSTRVD